MIHSYSKIKTDRNYNEDFKTYATLGVLQYLPAHVFWKLLRDSVIDNEALPEEAGEITQIDFWPKWYKIQNVKVVSNSTYIEPDVFIRFENFDCIVEVKKTDFSGQHSDQWENQTLAYRNEYPEDRRLIFIALGGNPKLDSTSQAKFCHVYKSTWQRLLREIDIALKEREGITVKTESVSQKIRILQAAVEAFARYNEYVVEFLHSLFDYNNGIQLPTQKSLNELWKI